MFYHISENYKYISFYIVFFFLLRFYNVICICGYVGEITVCYKLEMEELVLSPLYSKLFLSRAIIKEKKR
jgi:hypothetical protein